MAENETFMGEDGSFGDISKAPEASREFLTKKGFQNFDAFRTSYQELEGKLPDRENMIMLPKEGDTEGYRKMVTKLGCPEKAEDYKFTPKEGDPFDEKLVNLFKEDAFKNGMPQAAFADTVQFQVDALKAADQIYGEQTAKDVEEKQKAIRGRFNSEDEYKDFTQKALGFADAYKMSENRSLADVFEDKGLMHDPEILDVLASLADRVEEDPLPNGGTRNTPSKDAQLKEIQKNPAFTNGMHPDHNKVMKQYWALCGIGVQQEG